MKVSLRPVVEKQFRKLPPPEKKKVMRKLLLLKNDRAVGKPLQGEHAGSFSLRAWPYRIIYTIENSGIVIYSIAHRQGVYKY